MSPQSTRNDDRRYMLLGLRAVGEIGAGIAIPAVLGALAGKAIDARFGSAPYGLLVCMAIAFAITSFAIVRIAKRLGREYQRVEQLQKSTKNNRQPFLPKPMAIPIAAEPVISFGSFVITNSVLNGAIAAVFFIVLALALRGKRQMVPRGIQNAFEMVIEGLLSFMDQVTNDHKLSKRFLPFIGSLFFFILVSNWLGLFPGVGSIGVWQEHHGKMELIPLFRAATSDLNLTLALAVLSVLLSHIVGAVSVGFFRYWNKFIQIGGIWKSIVAFGKKPFGEAAIGVFAALVEFVVGLIELMSEIAKMLSLSLRLFGNVFAGEVLLTVMASLMAYALPLPFMGLEIIVGVVQALVFSTLTLVYLTLAVAEPHGSEEHDDAHHAEKAHAETAPAQASH